MPEQTIGWLPTLKELMQLRTEDPYYQQFGWDRLVVPTGCTYVGERMDDLNVRFYERYGNRMISHETLENWQIRLQNKFDEVVDKYNRAYALYDEHADGIMDDIRTGVKRTVNGENQASGHDDIDTANTTKQIDTPDSAVNESDDYADSYTKGQGKHKTTYGRKDTNKVTEVQEATGILLENINRTIDDYKDMDTQFVAEFENLFLNVFWY